MPFQQAPPTPGNQYEDDSVLRSYLARCVPADVLREIEPTLVDMGRLAGGDLYQMQLADRLNEQALTQWDAWGNRIDRIELTPLWRVAERSRWVALRNLRCCAGTLKGHRKAKTTDESPATTAAVYQRELSVHGFSKQEAHALSFVSP